jgi:hypothetical protein
LYGADDGRVVVITKTARALDTAGARRAVVLAGDGEQTDETGKAVGRYFCFLSVCGLWLTPSEAGSAASPQSWTEDADGLIDS